MGFAFWLRYWTDVAQREVNQTLHDVWTLSGLKHYKYTLGGSCPLTEFYQVQNSSVQVLRSPILQRYCTALE